MRLICPNCGAQYEVDDKVIPDAGRDVQCSNCGHTWFQQPAHLDRELREELDGALSGYAEEAEEPEAAPAPSQAPEKPKARNLDPSVANVLREEAQREAAARSKASSVLESQPDLGLTDDNSPAKDRSVAARARMARLRGGEDNDAEAAAALAAAAANGPRRDLLPDIEEINSTLRASQDREPPSDPVANVEMQATQDTQKRGGFRLGFGGIVIATLIAIAVYAFAPQISQSLPAAEPVLIKYVTWANTLREGVNGSVDSVIAKVNGLIAGGAATE